MTYLQKLEAELNDMLTRGQDKQAIVEWVSKKLLFSFKNGVTAGKKDSLKGTAPVVKS